MVGVPIDTSGSASAVPLGVRLAAGIMQAIERDPDIQRLIVALDETDDIGSAALTVLSDTELQASVYLDGIVATVDGVEMSTRLASEQPVATARGLDRLAIADRILVARSADLTPFALGAVAHVLRSVNQTGPIIAPAIAPCSLDNLLDLDAWSGSPFLRRSHGSVGHLDGNDDSGLVALVGRRLPADALQSSFSSCLP